MIESLISVKKGQVGYFENENEIIILEILIYCKIIIIDTTQMSSNEGVNSSIENIIQINIKLSKIFYFKAL